jgi:hypothetical protein
MQVKMTADEALKDKYVMDKQEWLRKCATRFAERSGTHPDDAEYDAEMCREMLGGDLAEDPEEAADEEMSNWN